MTQNTPVAGTILNQLGGSKFVAMTGAHSILNLENGLQLKFRGSKHANCVRIVLNQFDSYDIEFFTIKGIDARSHGKIEGVMVAQLRQMFENETGLYLNL